MPNPCGKDWSGAGGKQTRKRLVEGESRSRAKPDFCHAKHSGAGQKAAHIKKEKIILLTEVL